MEAGNFGVGTGEDGGIKADSLKGEVLCHVETDQAHPGAAGAEVEDVWVVSMLPDLVETVSARNVITGSHILWGGHVST